MSNARNKTPDLNPEGLPFLLRGEVAHIQEWIANPTAGNLGRCAALIFLGAGLFGGAMGYWRAPWQGAFAAVKFPLVILATTFGNALLNAMLAPLLGLNLAFRQSLLAILMSYAIVSVVLGGLSPLLLFLVCNTPPLAPGRVAAFSSHSLLLVSQVSMIAMAGLAAHLRLWQLLRRLSGHDTVAWKVFFGWLLGNLFLGSQISWIFRPFVGSPGLPVRFLREDALRGSFFEAVLAAINQLLS